MAKGVRARMIFDRSQFYWSSSARQALRVQELWNNGAEMKVLLPSRREGGGRGFPIMHCKTSIYDEAVVLSGSANLTHNGMECNKEHLYRISDERTVAK
eukprot:10328061-Karenia_brevis.AAC.1